MAERAGAVVHDRRRRGPAAVGLLVLLVAAAVLLVAAALLTGAARARSAPPSPPPKIHERFTVLPCTGAPKTRTTLEQEGCAEHQILAGDKQIDRLNRTIFAALAAAAARRRFTAAHKAWLVYRGAYCRSRSDAAEGGTEAGLIDALCTVDLNGQHVTSLREFLKDLRFG